MLVQQHKVMAMKNISIISVVLSFSLTQAMDLSQELPLVVFPQESARKLRADASEFRKNYKTVNLGTNCSFSQKLVLDKLVNIKKDDEPLTQRLAHYPLVHIQKTAQLEMVPKLLKKQLLACVKERESQEQLQEEQKATESKQISYAEKSCLYPEATNLKVADSSNSLESNSAELLAQVQEQQEFVAQQQSDLQEPFEYWRETNLQKSIKPTIILDSYDFVTLSPNGTIAVCSRSTTAQSRLCTTLYFFDTSTGKKIREFDRYAQLIKLVWSPDNQHCALQFFGNKIIFFNIKTGTEAIVASHKDTAIFTQSININNFLLLDGKDRTNIYDTKAGKTAYVLVHDNKNANAISNWSPDGRYLAHTSDCLTIVEPKTGEFLSEFAGIKNPDMLFWNFDGSMLASVFKKQKLLYIARNDLMARRLYCEREIGYCAWSNDGQKIAVKAKDTIEIWHPETGNQICTLYTRLKPEWAEKARILWSHNDTRLVMFVPGRDNICVWDLAVQKYKKITFDNYRVVSLAGNKDTVTALCKNQNNNQFAFFHFNPEKDI